jgi:hypothetical protein
MTPARLEANRRNAQKSTGPRTARGKAQSRMNSLRTGGRSRFTHDLNRALFDALPCSVDQVAGALLTPEQAAHPLFSAAVDTFRQAEIEVVWEQKRISARFASPTAPGGGAGRRPAGTECAPSSGPSGRRGDPDGILILKLRAKPECY